MKNILKSKKLLITAGSIIAVVLVVVCFVINGVLFNKSNQISVNELTSYKIEKSEKGWRAPLGKNGVNLSVIADVDDRTVKKILDKAKLIEDEGDYTPTSFLASKKSFSNTKYAYVAVDNTDYNLSDVIVIVEFSGKSNKVYTYDGDISDFVE